LIDKLTNTEKKILKEVGKGKTTNEIASDLFIASKTVEVHRRNIIRKLMLPSYRNALSSWAQSNFNLLQTDYLN
jgi:DNA-binding NarL/FixJ family response regulator